MPVYRLSDRLVFPPPEGADPSGLVAIGGDLRPERVMLGYSLGIFPWPHAEDEPMLWFSPDPRFVLPLDRVSLQRSLRKTLKREPYEVRFDTRFRDVIRSCSATKRPGQLGTWITGELTSAYVQLYELGFAHSIEAFRGDELVGGLYGVSIGRAFFGESMFATADDASKVAFTTLLGHLDAWGFAFVDCQVFTEHLARFGAEEWPREDYLTLLRDAVANPTRRGLWQIEMSAKQAASRFLDV